MTRAVGRRSIAALIFLFLLVLGLSLCRRGILLSDEGFLLLEALDMLQGKVLYRDMDAFVAPGTWLLMAGVFSIVEPSVLASRLPVLVCFLATFGLAYRIVARLGSPGYGIFCVVLLALASVWAFPFWTFAWYSPFSILFVLLALERLLAWQQSRRTSALLATGLGLGLAFVFKQNYGAYAAAGSVLLVLATRAEEHGPAGRLLRDVLADALRLGAGAACVALPVIGYFVLQGAGAAFVDRLLLHPLEFLARADIPYPSLATLLAAEPLRENTERLTYLAFLPNRLDVAIPVLHELGLVERLHVLLYWLPPLVFTVGSWRGLR
ncbi:MAG: glycosyltransferase family 39 protein, partial [Myxococcota bacterium]